MKPIPMETVIIDNPYQQPSINMSQNGTLCQVDHSNLLQARFFLVFLVGTIISIIGVIENSILFYLLLSRKKFRLSPIFFLSFVAFFDLILDLGYLPCISLEMLARWHNNLSLYSLWHNHMKVPYTISQIAKTASIFCLIMASFERFRGVRHWTFTGFETNTRIQMLLVATLCAAVARVWVYSEISLYQRPECQGLAVYMMDSQRQSPLYHFVQDVVGVLVPFGCLIYLNYGIVAKLRKQRPMELRSMMLELAVGKEQLKDHKKRIRNATRTLVAIISAYLISNLLKVFLTIWDSLDPRSLRSEFSSFYKLSEDSASLMAMLGNVVRLPIYTILDPEIRQEFFLMLFRKKKISTCQESSNITPESKFRDSGIAKIRRFSEVIDRPIRLSAEEVNGNLLNLGWCNNLLLRASHDDLLHLNPRNITVREYCI